jgi:hypothetical protein
MLVAVFSGGSSPTTSTTTCMQSPPTNHDISTTPTVSLTVHDNVDIPENVTDGVEGPSSHVTSTQKDQGALDIEHVLVQDDPREWSRKRKVRGLAHVSLSYSRVFQVLHAGHCSGCLLDSDAGG